MVPLFALPLLVLFGSTTLVTSKLDAINKAAIANNMFALKLHKTYDQNGNAFSSPVSIFASLGMLYAGAKSKTRVEICQALSCNPSGLGQKNIGKHLKNFLGSLSGTSDNGTMKIANALLSERSFPVSEKYKKFVKKMYSATVKEVDFINDAEKAVDEINDWVRNKTEGKITKLLESLDKDTVLVLLNAVYFKGNWEIPFDDLSTNNETFYNDGTEEVFVPMMYAEDDFLHGKFPEYGVEAIKLPYAGNEFSMTILLPLARDGVRVVEEKLTLTLLDNILKQLEEEKVKIRLPKFKLKDSRELKESLEALGMKTAFSESANFQAISNIPKLQVSKIVHNAAVEVSEHGTEASGATVIGITGRSFMKTTKFTIDHPFLFLIRHEGTGAIVFFGRVNQL